jgi:hypothetical protein
MATQPLAVLPMPNVTGVLSQFNRDQLANAIEVMIALLDVQDSKVDPDEPDFSPMSDGKPGTPEDYEPTGDEESGAYVEWHTKSAVQRRTGKESAANGAASAGSQEDDEDDDPPGQYDEDAYTSKRPKGYGPGCAISDPGGCEHDGREEDASTLFDYGVDQSAGPLAPHLAEDRTLMQPHLLRVRSTRCRKISLPVYGNAPRVAYRLEGEV